MLSPISFKNENKLIAKLFDCRFLAQTILKDKFMNQRNIIWIKI